MSFFRLQHISKSYKELSILRQVNFELNSGEIFGLLGESGSGKSTLLRIAAGLIDADEGEVWIGSEKLPPASDQLIPGHPDIKIVHQDYQLSLPLTTRENINYALRFYEKTYRNERIEELLELCHLQAVADRPAKLLSGGEKQRTAIARALAEEARVLLLDEPFAHLDLPNRRRLSDTLRELTTQSDLACLFVTHDAQDALSLCHQMAVLKEGELLQKDTPEAIYQTPANTYIAALTGEIILIEPSFFQHYFNISAPLLDHQIVARPEHFQLSTIINTEETEWVKTMVKRVAFEGSRYKIEVLLENTLLSVYYSTPLPLESEVFIKYVAQS
ncbi:ABC transporter ATP-binding protein [Runella sp. MFBS21]|uniref:ABC transporter ATP-binding protein n=1 Tax=Runella sp. MFBS21 TaxID=3034018 RepID=UPI0023F784BC|nr:ABC transporter ATP-binding protein [Runella sp. MFBS21]MDF7819446.1 ABC transporter ATP-binding protein [Runella sp. MFBS21]